MGVRRGVARPIDFTQNRSDGMMKKFLSKYQCDWGHISFLVALLLIISLYLTDAIMASRKAENLMMILPVSLIGIGICLWQIRLSARPRTSTSQSESAQTETYLFKYRVPIFMGLLGLYLLGLIYVAFDVATFLFIWLSLLMQGEQRKVLAFFYALLFAVGVTWCLKLMVPFPFTTMFF
ncbi:hypothetical protein [Zwartia sp.]|uniref:hypothetical protein n=1 Tax=Zwartia sp. TaxID=2978004 RepID=UPI002724D262|nr:hypothetical protein [Zwartia sp.]MDO9024439.1 hypothetical protein [Zwartia sp.]